MAETRKTTARPPRGERAPKRAASSPGAGNGGGGSGTSGGAPAPAPTPLRGADKKLHDGLMSFYGTIGMGAQGVGTMTGDMGLVVAGANIATQASPVADAWVEVSRDNPRVRAMLEGFLTGTSVATLVGLHVSMVLPMLASRGVLPWDVAQMFLTPEARELAAAAAAQAAAAAAANNGHPGA